MININIDKMIEKMSLIQKVSQLRNKSRRLSRLGLNEYDWWNEALHGVGRAGLATVFPQAIGMAATFDKQLIQRVGDIVSQEARAKFNKAQKEKDYSRYKGLTFWSPNINIYRDPRWGRGQETYGEDPHLTAMMGVAYITGLQGSDPTYLKVAACAKHFAVHSGPESNRHYQNVAPSMRELYDTYLPAFEAAVKEAKVESVMTAYNAVHGMPCSCNENLLKDVLREKWGFKGHVVSDCGAIRDIFATHKTERNPLKAIARAVNAGCDLECGSYYALLPAAVKMKYVNEQVIDDAVRRLLSTRARLGMLDKNCPYDIIGEECIASQQHEDLAVAVAEKSLVLLKNDGVLPLDKTSKVAVIGCNAKSNKMLLGNYEGTPTSCINIYDGINAALSTNAAYAEGCHITNLSLSGQLIKEAIAVAETSDIIVLCLGLDASLEGEEGDADGFDESGNSYRGDRATLSLPRSQIALIDAVIGTNKKVVLLNFSGGAVTFNGNEKYVNAIMQCWYPGAKGGRAVANVLTGRVSPSGKLPITFYKHDTDLPLFEDYSMDNRTYRYYKGEVLYPFGHGLSYNKVKTKVLGMSCDDGGNIDVKIELFNKGNMVQDEVLQLYVALSNADAIVPIKSLKAFERVTLGAGESRIVDIKISEALIYIDDNGDKQLHDREFDVYLNSNIIIREVL